MRGLIVAILASINVGILSYERLPSLAAWFIGVAACGVLLAVIERRDRSHA